jgi:Ferritin-like domain
MPEIGPAGRRMAPPVKRYGLAVCCVAAAVLVTGLLRWLMDRTPWMVFLAAVLLSSGGGGLGPGCLAVPHDAAELTRIERPPRGREEVPVQLSRLLETHELVLTAAQRAAKQAAEAGDDGTNDLLVGRVIRTYEMQVWFLAEHLVDTPPVRAE